MPTTERTRARPAVAISTPSLTRHLVFYFPERDLTEKDSDALSTTETCDFILEYITSLRELAPKRGVKIECCDDATLTYSLKTYASFAIGFGTFLGLSLRIIVAMYHEHFTVTYILDNTSPLKTERLSVFSSSVESFFRHITLHLDRFSTTPDGATYKRADHSAILKLSNYHGADINNHYINDVLYRDVWVALDVYLNNNNVSASRWLRAMKEDIRGLLLTPEPETEASAKTSELDKETEIFSEMQRYRGFSNDGSSLTSKPLRANTSRFLDNERSFFSSTLSLDTSIHQTSSSQQFARWDQNSILCFICAKAAIYGSSLFFLSQHSATTGSHADLTKQDKNIEEHHKKYAEELIHKHNNKLYDYRRYFVIYDGTSDYSLGRIVRRLHVLSDLRCVAFVERRYVDSINKILRIMGADLSAILEKMTHTRTPPTLNINALNLIIDAYNETGRSSIYSTKPRTNVNDLLLERHDKQTKGNLGRYRSASSGDIHFFRCNGGLTYRINRCKYYYDHLMHRLSDMRVERIKGFQPYDRFVERNYYQMIQSIFAIGERHAQLGARVDRALTITHSLQQRRMATYALIAGLIFSFFPGMSWLTTAIINTTDQTHKPLIPLFIFSSAATLLSILYVFYIILEKALRSDKLYVDIEGNNPTVMSDPDD